MNRGQLIFQYVERGKRKSPDLATRLDRAAAIVRGPRPCVRVSDATWIIPSQTSSIGYVVNHACTCPDFTGVDPRSGEVASPPNRAPGGWCKHRLAMLMLVQLEHDQDIA